MTLTELGRFISLILRHKPQVVGITLDAHGWADTAELIKGINEARPEAALTMPLLQQIVSSDSKGRYAFNADGTKIRANQGHSVAVDVELERKAPPQVLYHGTGAKFVAGISELGLIPKTRLYVHLSADVETAMMVGSRHGTPVIFRVAAGEMERDGCEFFLSANRVWLTKAVPVRYLSLT